MNKIATIIAAGALALGVQAAPITGSFGFTGTFATDNEDLDQANNLFIITATVNTLDVGTALDVGGSDDANGINIGDSVNITSPIHPGNAGGNATPLGVIYTVGGFQLNLSSFLNLFEDAETLSLRGTGTLTGNGYDPTPGSVNLSFNRAGRSPNVSLTFSATSAGAPREITTPDGGSTAMLLGFGLIGAAAVRRKLS
jgi:hypothetical protein